MAQVLFHSTTEEIGLIDLVVLEEAGTGDQQLHIVGEPITVALHYGGDMAPEVRWVAAQLDAWAETMSVVTMNVLEVEDETYLHMCGRDTDVTITIGHTFGLL